MIRAALALLLALPAAADDVPDHYTPRGPVVQLDTLRPQFRAGGSGHVRLVREDGTRLAARLDANEWERYQRAYNRALARLALRMPVPAAEPLARRAAWTAVVGAAARREGTVRDLPRR